MVEQELNKSVLTELFRARNDSCPEGKKWHIRKSLITNFRRR